MKQILFLLLIVPLTCCKLFQQNMSEGKVDLCNVNAHAVISISKILLDQPDIVDLLSFHSSGSDTFYVRNPFDTALIMDTAISYKKIVANQSVFFYDFPELIVYEKKAWLEYVTIKPVGQSIQIAGRIMVRYPEISTVVDFIAVFKCDNTKFELLSLKI